MLPKYTHVPTRWASPLKRAYLVAGLAWAVREMMEGEEKAELERKTGAATSVKASGPTDFVTQPSHSHAS